MLNKYFGLPTGLYFDLPTYLRTFYLERPFWFLTTPSYHQKVILSTISPGVYNCRVGIYEVTCVCDTMNDLLWDPY